MRFSMLIAIAGLVSMFSVSGLAHHSTNSIYDEERVVEISGVVKDWQFVNPHPYLILEITGEDGETNDWNVSFGGAAVTHLSRQGFSRETFTPGEVVVVEGYPARAEGAYGLLVEGGEGGLTREDGTPIP